jgi:hypothetical protein
MYIKEKKDIMKVKTIKIEILQKLRAKFDYLSGKKLDMNLLVNA